MFTGNVLNTRNLFATIAALASKNPTGFKSFSYLTGGDYLGQQVGKTIEQARGFGAAAGTQNASFFAGVFGYLTLRFSTKSS